MDIDFPAVELLREEYVVGTFSAVFLPRGPQLSLGHGPEKGGQKDKRPAPVKIKG